ncbi:MAG: tyrosine-type recombinase/integrase [Planctomycetes bacterium]|nr:tyrosine-type recombinase/integrase [Planctomycetota bacterium]
MSRNESFHSVLAEVMADFVVFKRMQGYDYSQQVRLLGLFDRFLCGQDIEEAVLRTEHISAYLATTAGLATGTRGDRLSVVRQFSLYAHARHPEHAVAQTSMLPCRHRPVRFYRIPPDQVSVLMDTALELRPARSVRPHCIHFLIGLLYCTGLRISEALNLELSDVDLAGSTLLVRRGKFDRERLLALSPSTTHALRNWLEIRSRFASTSRCAPFLVGGLNRGLTYNQARDAFLTLCQRCGLNALPPPRLHDLRHNYACRCIEQWREQSKDIQALLPILAAAMGHVTIRHTQVYIHTQEAALQAAADTFRNYVNQQRKQAS